MRWHRGKEVVARWHDDGAVAVNGGDDKRRVAQPASKHKQRKRPPVAGREPARSARSGQATSNLPLLFGHAGPVRPHSHGRSACRCWPRRA